MGLINWVNAVRDPIAADVTGDGNVTPFDASYILRYVANLIQIFPVEESTMARRTVPLKSKSPIISLETPPLKMGERITLPVMLENAEAVYAVGLTLSFNSDVLRFVSVAQGEVTEGFSLSHAVHHDKIRIALAGTRPGSSDGCLLNLVFDVLSKSVPRSGDMPLVIESIVLNDGIQPVEIENQLFVDPVGPDQFELYQNHPNPFNPETTIRYGIPNDTQVKIDVYNSLGEKVRTLIDQNHKAGSHTVRWDAKNDEGRPVSGGIYVFRMKAGSFVQARKMLLIR